LAKKIAQDLPVILLILDHQNALGHEVSRCVIESRGLILSPRRQAQEFCRDFETERLGGLEVEDQLEPGRLWRPAHGTVPPAIHYRE